VSRPDSDSPNKLPACHGMCREAWAIHLREQRAIKREARNAA
jgi:hypothetical protein